MQDTPAAEVESVARARPRRRWRRLLLVLAVMLLLFGVPWWTLLAAGTAWPTATVVAGTLLFAAGFAGLPLLMMLGHGRRHLDGAAAAGDALLGAAWVLFVWSVLGQALRLVLAIAGVEDPARSRVVAGAVVAVVAVLLVWGHFEAMRVPRVRRVEVGIAGLGGGLDGVRVAMITDTHYGPIDRARWSAAVVARVNDLDADVVCHVGDIADGTVAVREAQASPLASVRAASARVYVTGNHEYFSEAQGWLDYMESIGWDALHNRHIVVERGGDRLVVAGVDDATAAASGVHGHGANLQAALAGADRDTAGAAARASAQADTARGARRSGPADLGPHPRRPDLAVQCPRPAGPAGGPGTEQARRADPALHESGHRLLGPAVPGVRAERDHPVDAAPHGLITGNNQQAAITGLVVFPA